MPTLVVVGRRGPPIDLKFLLLATLYFLTAAALFTLYILARRITTSSELYEGIPAYIVAIQLIVSGGLLGLVSGVQGASRSLGVRFAAGTCGISLILTLVALAMAMSIYERHSSFTLCLLRTLCICRLDTDSLAPYGWDAFHGTNDCLFLPRLSSLIIASALAQAAGALLSLLSLAALLLPSLHPEPHSSTMEEALRLNDSSLRTFLARFHAVVFPPTYEESQEHPAPILPPDIRLAPPPYSISLAPHNSALNKTHDNITILELSS